MEDRELFDKKVRFHVYDTVMKSGKAPTIADTSAALSQSEDEIRESFKRLADAHMLILQKATGEILMANPFSTVPTPFVVRVGDMSYFGSCIWDSMGIPAMLKKDAVIETSCACCGTAMNLEISASGEIKDPQGIAHFAVPARHWWDDIVYN